MASLFALLFKLLGLSLFYATIHLALMGFEVISVPDPDAAPLYLMASPALLVLGFVFWFIGKRMTLRQKAMLAELYVDDD